MKKPVLVTVSVLAAAALVTGGIFGISAWKKAGTKVKVFPVTNVTTSYYGDGFSSGGMVSTDVSQDVYLADTDIIKTIFVTQGQTVSVGDPLIEYDTALAALQLQIKELEIQSLQNKYSDALAELDRVSKLRAGQAKTAAASFAGLTYTDATALSSLDDTNTDAYYNTETADGSSANPFTYLMTSGAKITSRYMLAMSQKAQTAGAAYYTLFEVRQGNTDTGSLLYAWSMVFAADGSFSFSISSTPKPVVTPTPVVTETQVVTPTPVVTETPVVTATPEDTASPGPSESPEPIETYEPYYPPVERYTQDEIDKLVRDQKAAVSQAELDIKTATLERQSLQGKLENAVVKAQINGTVKTLAEETDARMNSTPIISVTGGNGYLITASVSETNLPLVTVGAVFSVQSWESGASGTARVTAVSEYPVYTDSNGSLPSSQYTFTAYVEEDVGLRNGEYVDMTLAGQTSGDSTAWYLQRMFIREDENGASYVMVRGEDGKLHRQTVVTGKMVYGAYLEIKSGLTQDDYIAFPYGKNVTEGVNTETDDSGDMSWLYQ